MHELAGRVARMGGDVAGMRDTTARMDSRMDGLNAGIHEMSQRFRGLNRSVAGMGGGRRPDGAADPLTTQDHAYGSGSAAEAGTEPGSQADHQKAPRRGRHLRAFAAYGDRPIQRRRQGTGVRFSASYSPGSCKYDKGRRMSVVQGKAAKFRHPSLSGL